MDQAMEKLVGDVLDQQILKHNPKKEPQTNRAAVYPVRVGDVTSLGGLQCRVIYVNHQAGRATVEFHPDVKIHDLKEKGCKIKKFGPPMNRSARRTVRSRKRRAGQKDDK